MKSIHALLFGALLLGACAQPEPEAAPEAPEAETQSAVRSSAPLDANAADLEVIAASEAVSDELAAAIVEGRPYADATELDAVVSGFVADETLRDAVYADVFVPVELNSASAAAILLIPGVGDRMLHEFEEYRPYVSIEQFRREIGKYVDDAELARLEGYVYLADN